MREAWPRVADRLVRDLSTGEPDGLPEAVVRRATVRFLRTIVHEKMAELPTVLP